MKKSIEEATDPLLARFPNPLLEKQVGRGTWLKSIICPSETD